MGVPSILCFFKNKAKKDEKRAISLFVVFPLVATLIQVLAYGLSIIQAGITISLLLIYVMFQSRAINESLDRAKIFEEISNTDVLTHLKNRRAYECKIENVNHENWVGVIYFDLNGLKITNDTKGHKAGDILIINFANMLRNHFSENEVFRISGDEFVIISLDKENFDENSKKLLSEITDKASSGISYGNGNDILNIIKKSEKAMYKDKKEYYQRAGNERRRV